jgi:hypothetical protein
MKNELNTLLAQLAKDTGISPKLISPAAKKAILSGRINKDKMIKILHKLAD